MSNSRLQRRESRSTSSKPQRKADLGTPKKAHFESLTGAPQACFFCHQLKIFRPGSHCTPKSRIARSGREGRNERSISQICTVVMAQAVLKGRLVRQKQKIKPWHPG